MAARWRAEQHVPVFVRVLVTVGVVPVLAVHGPKETEDEHDRSEDHTAQAKGL